jgi:hypothetical protein
MERDRTSGTPDLIGKRRKLIMLDVHEFVLRRPSAETRGEQVPVRAGVRNGGGHAQYLGLPDGAKPPGHARGDSPRGWIGQGLHIADKPLAGLVHPANRQHVYRHRAGDPLEQM